MLTDGILSVGEFPRQQISWKQKTQKWASECVAYIADKNLLSSSPVRNSVRQMRINYDLYNGIIHMDDVQSVINPNGLIADVVPEQIQHYPIMNTKLDLLEGEEASRSFDGRMIITNPNALTELEEAKHEEMVRRVQEALAESSQNEEEFQQKIQDAYDDLKYNFQDSREVIANQLISHYRRQYDFDGMFNLGLKDAEIVGEEAFQVYIDHGEPNVRKLHPAIIRAYGMGYSNRLEDASMIALEEYWSKSRIIDIYGDQMTKKEVAYVQEYKVSDDLERDAAYSIGAEHASTLYPTTLEQFYDYNKEEQKWTDDPIGLREKPVPLDASNFATEDYEEYGGFDVYNNVRVIQVFWKTLRKIKKVTSYDPITGEKIYNLYTEDYIPNKEMGETAEDLWINQAWQGVKIGDRLFLNMGPCPVQFNEIDNPTKCHFGIIGTIYNTGDGKPFSMVDKMKPYAYLYDAIFDRLNKLIARNYGKVIRLDWAKKPNSWTMDKWLRILISAGVAVENSFEEGQEGAAKGKLAGALNNASTGVIDMELGASISNMINTLVTLESFMGKVVGITDQREGQIANRETVGGVERSVLQSSHITEWLFTRHNNTKKRVYDAFVDMARACLRGRTKKFQYITSADMAQQIINVDGDFFASASYGMVIDDGKGAQEFNRQLPTIIQAGMQNQLLDLSTVMKIFNTDSRAEKQKIIEDGERALQERQQQMQQNKLESQQQIAQMTQQTEAAKMEHEAAMNSENNETKLIIEEMKLQAQANVEPDATAREQLDEKKREFNASYQLDKERLEFDKRKAERDAQLKEKQINNRPRATATK